MNPKSLPYVSLLALTFGSTLIASRFGVSQFAALTYVGLRLLLAGLAYAMIFAASSRRAWPRERSIWRHAPVLGIVATAIPMTFIVASLQFQSAGVTALLLTTAPAFTVVLAHFFLPEERLNGRKALGVLLAIGGAATLVLQGESGLPDIDQANPIGYVMVIAGIFSGSVGAIYVRRFMRDSDPIDAGAVRMWTAAVVVMPIAFIATGFDLSQVQASGYAAVLYAGLVGTFGGMLLEFRIIQRFGATATAVAANLIPIVALIGGWLFLDEQITAGMIVAMVLIIGGVTIITRSETVPLAEPIES